VNGAFLSSPGWRLFGATVAAIRGIVFVMFAMNVHGWFGERRFALVDS